MDKRIKVLLAEDEIALAQIVKDSLETRNFEVVLALNGDRALELFDTILPDVVVLDVMMPKKDGFAVAKTIRQINQSVPIIFLTAKSQTKDVVEGFSIGGNDYLKKPFSIEELIVRIHNLLGSNNGQNSQEPLTFSNFKLDLTKQTLQFGEQKPESLTMREAELLFYLIKNQNKVLDKSVILTKLWGQNDFFNGRSMDVFISKLRKKLASDEKVQILNVRGVGYKLVC